MNLDFSGRSVLVTGAGANLGLAVARAFLDAGARVALCDRTAAGTRAALAAIPAGQRDRVLAKACDVADAPAVARLWSRGRLGVDGLDDPLRGSQTSAVIEPEAFSASSLAISSAALNPTTCRSSSRACRAWSALRWAMPFPCVIT